ncbi:SRPBCC family protein [Rariglobus hedericola]|uniref:SRPBCC family protein n=1 Tax=Rariglobus hedericola TaxID=2597822 RepID=A0A556QNR0_9BACT|nr:SRPBCC family protein [Rariglobus hedericola]TSJ78232.1 SRPBCC family protein [Rariglobus hedericola]
MLKKILLVAAVLVTVFIVVVAMQPAEFRVARTTVIAASPATVFAKVNDLRTWQEFSPWAKIDPNAKATFAGPQTGTGSSFTWVGNSEVGEGTMTIVESRPHELIRFKLEFVKPFEGTNDAEFTFKPVDAQTEVTWSMSGKNNFFFKAVGLFIDCEKMIGPQFEEGLANLKALSEAPAKP